MLYYILNKIPILFFYFPLAYNALNSQQLAGKTYDEIINPLNQKIDGKIESGSYVGNGTYGINNAVTVQLQAPSILFLIRNPRESVYTTSANIWWMKTQSTGSNGYTGKIVYLTWEENYISWYSDETNVNGPAYLQLNGSGETYYWYSFS